jgi:N utilization substance protein A
MTVTLTDEARRVLALFEDVTGATGRDCLVYEDRVVVLVARGDMGEAIGPGGEHVRDVEAQLDTEVKLVEDASTPADFVANALAPAAVYNVTISENGDTVAYVEVDEADTGVAIGEDGRNIEAARELARRHVDVDDVELT